MAKIFAVVALALALPQASVTPKPAVDVTAADIQATIQKEIASSTPIRRFAPLTPEGTTSASPWSIGPRVRRGTGRLTIK